MFGTAIVGYLFLGGAGAGACAVLAVLALLVPRDRLAVVRIDAAGARRPGVRIPLVYRRLMVPGYAVALVALVVAVALLLVDLGRADRLLLLLQPKATYLSMGAYALGLCVVLAAAMALAWLGVVRLARVELLRVLSAALGLVALVVMTYTGLLLGGVAAVPLWATLWLPVLFVLSALSCGLALVTGAAYVSGAAQVFTAPVRALVRADVAVVVLEALAAFAVVGWPLAAAGEAGADATQMALLASAQQLAMGSLASVFWLGFVGCGPVAPVVVDVAALLVDRAAPLRKASLARLLVGLLACAGVLAGGLALRWCLVEAGVHPAASTLFGG